MARCKYKTFRPRKDETGQYKEKLCAVCGKPLVAGEQYCNVWNYYNDWSMHTDCYRKSPRSRWETSEYIGRVYDIQDNFNVDEIDGTISDLEDLKSDLEYKLDAMPYQLQDSESGSLLQERIEQLEEAVDELERIRDEIDEQNNRVYEDEKEDFETEEEFEDDKQYQLEDLDSQAQDALSYLV